MKRIYFFLGALIISSLSFGQVLTEDFSYTAGQLISANGWTAHSGAGTNAITVTSPGLTYSGHPGSGVGNAVSMTTSGEDDNKAFTAITTGSVYMSFLVNVSAAQATGDYFIGLFQSTSIFPVRIFAKSDVAAGYFFGVSKGASVPAVYETTPRVFGTTYLVVTNYIYNSGTTTDDVINVWVNPALGAAEPAASIPGVTGTSTDATTIGAVYLRQGTAANASTQVVDAILVGTTWASVTPGGAPSPSLSATTLTSFSNVCINTTAGPNSFTITGTNLTTADVTVAALPGFSYSTTSGGTYTSTLTLTQPGGAYSQQVFVKFDPTLVQSYNGNIVVGGGGASAVNVAATGSGINTAPSVTSGSASTITQTSATVAGSISATGCTAISAYGIEWSTTGGFANGTGTAVPSSNLTGGNFSSDLSGLSTGTTYYYHAYATNAGGTSYGAEQSLTTLTPNPNITATTLTSFGNVCVNTTAGPNSFTINGTNLSNADVTLAALAGFTYSTTSGGTYTSTLTLTQPGGTFSQEVFVKFEPTLVQSYNGNISVSGGGIAVPVSVAATGSGVNTAPAVTSGSASAITTTSATVAGTITSTGCAAITAYGVEWSTTGGFANGTGTAVPASNLAGGNFSSNISGLTAGTTYYFHAYATNGGGTSYGSQGSFSTTSAGGGGTVVISQVYGGGGNASATYNQDFVELYNPGTNPVDISGWSIQYASATGPSTPGNWAVAAIPASTTIAPGKYYLVALATGATGIALPTPDVTGTLNLSGTAGKVALVNNSTPINGTTACSVASVVDVLGYGSTATCSETAVLIPTGIDNTKSMFRKNNGCTETNNNSSDFEVLSVSPRNSASPANICGAPAATLTTSVLTSFDNVCINTTAGPNSLTITGINLTTADVTVAALTGFSYSTTSGGTYTSSLTLTQPGGAFSQEVFVKFDPTAVQSYNGNIVVSGGGATPVNAAASGAGINTMPGVTSGSASVITQVSATVAGTINSTGCTAVSAYGIEYSTTIGFANGSGTAVASTNLAGGNFSSDLAGLSPGVTYYYHAYATNGGGTAYGAEQSFITTSPNPSITTTALSSFGNVCVSVIAGPNTFTINGTNLTNVDINVGPLAGFMFSVAPAGPYTASLILPQPGGTYSQLIYVQFMPMAVQSYNGNIVVNGGGLAAPVNVSATGAGVNTTPTVATGGSSAITTTTATLAGNFTLNGCTPITVYGIEYSTTNGFANGSGIQVISTNEVIGNYTAALSGLTPATIYYYKAYATNSGGTSWGVQQSFTTAAPPPPTLTATAVTGFGTACIGVTVGPFSFALNGSNLTNTSITVGPLAGYYFAENPNDVFSNIVSFSQPGGTLTKTIYVKFAPTAAQSYNGNVPVAGGGTTGTLNVPVVGTGVNTPPSLTTNPASDITTNSAKVGGSITASPCTNVTSYGIEYSSINGFADGTGTKLTRTNISGNDFTFTLEDLVQGATYYYKAFATNAGGTTYGAQQTFTVNSISNTFNIFPVPAAPGSHVRFSMGNITPGNYSLLFYNSMGELVLQHNMNVQSNYINQLLTIPGTMGRGVYHVYLMNTTGIKVKKTILVL